MKRFLSIFLALVMTATAAGCASAPADDDIISGSGDISFSQGSSSEVHTPEFPDASSKPDLLEGESSSSSKPASSSSSSSSKPAKSSSSPSSSSSSESQSQPQKPSTPASGEVRAVWLSYLELDGMLKGKSKSQFTSSIRTSFDKMAAAGMNMVFAQVRPFGDAIYDSSVFPWSYLCTGTEGSDPGFDPLDIMINEAHARDMKIEAWLNPYRIRTKGSKVALSSDNPASSFLSSGSNAVIEFDGGKFYNPGSQEARDLITEGVVEIVSNYAVDGIHFDDYFYPTTSMSFDSDTYAASGSSLSQADWRRDNVNKLVRQVYSSIKSVNSSVNFGISPQGNMSNNYNGQFIDVAKWVSTSGYVDYICPQIYYGFENTSQPFADTVKSWNNLIKVSSVELYVGLAPYKLGTTDNYAGTGKSEWTSTTDILARMVKESRKNSKFQGFCLYRYDSLFTSPNQQAKTELSNLTALLG